MRIWRAAVFSPLRCTQREAAPLSASRLLMSPLEALPSRANHPQQPYKYPQAQLLSAFTHSLTQSLKPLRRESAHLTTHPHRVGGPHLEQSNTRHPPEKQREKMSTYVSSECRRVSPSVHGNKFDTAHRKKAVANIFENVNQDSLMRLFQKTGDMKAEERVRSIFSYTQDPEETARALMALKQRKKDKFLQIAGMVRQLLKLR